MTMRSASPPIKSRRPSTIGSSLPRLLVAGLLGVLAALLVSCSGSGKGLIPTGNAGPLQSDFEAVARAAESANGSCGATESALLKTEQDFAALPSGIDTGLRNTLRQGIENLRKRALEMCEQPRPQPTNTTSTPKTTTSTTTPTTTPTETTSIPTETTPATTPAPSGPGGGTPAPGSEGAPGAGNEAGGGAGIGAGEAGGAGGEKVGGGQEAGGK